MVCSPSKPTANPTRLAEIIMRTLPTLPRQHSIRYAVGWFSHLLLGNRAAAVHSGTMNNTINQPQISRRSWMSCHSATKVKTIRNVMMDRAVVRQLRNDEPPRGM